jgi:hypothetical protein
MLDPMGTGPVVGGIVGGIAGCGLGVIISGTTALIVNHNKDFKTAACSVGCSAAGGCIAGALPGIIGGIFAPALPPPTLLRGAGCLGGALGSLFTGWCDSHICGCRPPLNACDWIATAFNAFQGCLAATSMEDKKFRIVMGALGVDIATVSSICAHYEGGKSAPPEFGKACCTFRNGFDVWRETIPCNELNPWTCCQREASKLLWFDWTVVYSRYGTCGVPIGD